ncbi:MAG: recombinase family protein [Mycobacteriales bacterium]
MRVATYPRVGVASRPGRAAHPARQRRLAASLASWPNQPVASYADLGSSQKRDRPGLAAALSDAAHGRYDLLLVDDASRLARDPGAVGQILGHFAATGVGVRFLGPERAQPGWLAQLATAALIAHQLG